MLLNVDDFGLKPDGRFLERASISAGSSVLTDADRNLRETDIGKKVAIPGAQHLTTTITELVDSKVVENASMDATSKNADFLFASLPPGEGFRSDLHLGKRITVTGAGTGGTTFVSDIVNVINASTLQLAHAAVTTVTGAKAILNRPDRVGLGDHARATADNVTVNLGDRTIVDGHMIVGGRGLDSPTAKFSSLDLCKQVVIQGAGYLLTAVQSFQNPGQATLADTAQRTVTGGLADIWNTDCQQAFENLISTLDTLDTEGVEIQFGAGVYDFGAASAAGAGISLGGLRNLTLRGAGPGTTILRLMPDQDLEGPAHVVHILGCKNLSIRDLSVHGAYLTLRQVNEQMHGILIDPGSEELVVEHVRVFQSSGDGIRLVGQPDKKVRRVWVQGCRLIQNKRTGIGVQRGVEYGWIRDCYIESTPPSTDAGINFEPSLYGTDSSQAPSDFVIDRNVLVHGTPVAAVIIQGVSGTDPALRINFTSNTVQDGGILAVNAQDITVANNRISASTAGQVINFRGVNGACSDLRFCNNRILTQNGVRTALLVASDTNFTSSRVWVEANDITTNGAGIELIGSADDIFITGNVIQQLNAQADEGAIQLSNALRIQVCGNHIGGSPPAAAVAMGGVSDDWRIFGNNFAQGRRIIIKGVGSTIISNFGYNPLGVITNPWPLTGTDLTNLGSGGAVPKSGVAYTVRHTPKTLVISGGNVSQILVNAVDSGSKAGSFRLGVGETIAISYSPSPPNTLVFAE